MDLRVRKLVLSFVVTGMVLGLAVLVWSPGGPALGQSTMVRVVSPDTASVDESFVVTIDIADVTNLGAYEWVLTYDPDVVDFVVVDLPDRNPIDGPFLSSTGRSVFCPQPIIDEDEGVVHFICLTSGQYIAGPSVSGEPRVLSFVMFTALTSGSTSLCIKYARLVEPDGYTDIDTGVANDSIAVGGAPLLAPECAPAATPTRPVPAATNTPHGPPGFTPEPTAPPTTPGPTATPATPAPTGPTPTPAATPPPDQADVVQLAAVCNPVTTTYPDGTTVQTLAVAVSPPGNLVSMWAFDEGFWLGYSPQYPQASDLAAMGFLDVVFLCLDAPATFVRPLV